MVANGEFAPSLSDDRGAARGWGRLVYFLFWVAGVVTVVIGLAGVFSDPEEPIGAHLVTLFAGVLYVAAAVGLTHNGKRMRILAWSCIAVCLAGPVILGLMEVGGSPETLIWSPWADFGSQVWYSSIALPIVGLVWLWWSNPRRIVEISEGLDRRRRAE